MTIPLWKQHLRKDENTNNKNQNWIQTLSSFNLTDYFQPNKFLKNRNHSPNIFVNLDLPQSAHLKPNHPNKDWLHPSNQVQTAKYSLITFIPRNLAEQFQRVANVFFLLLVILQFIPKFSQVSPFLAALPLLSVLAISAIKDAYEDLRRHRADYKTNHQIAHRLTSSLYTNNNLSIPPASGFKPSWLKSKSDHSTPSRQHWWSFRRKVSPVHPSDQSPSLNSQSPQIKDEKDDNSSGFEPTCWQDLRVGDFIRLRNNDPVPADLIICSTSDSEENVCFIETRNLDGETNLKSRHALQALHHIRSAQDCSNDQNNSRNKFIIENELPNANMFTYSAAVILPEPQSNTLNHSQDPSSNSNQPTHRVPVDLNSVLLRGTVVRNTEWVIGVICFTGTDTKIMMNASGTPSKRSKVERQMNPMVFINLTILAAMCIFNAVGTRISDQYYYDRNSYWTIDQNTSLNGLLGFVYAMITYQNIVPISLYISIEFVRTLQAYFIWADDDMVKDDRRTLARSWNLSDDLGQVQYVFSDKTGTLTQNLMQFRQCSVGGKVYRGKEQLGSIGEEDEEGSTVHGDVNLLKSPVAGLGGLEIEQDSNSIDQEKNAEKLKVPSQPFKDSELMNDLAQTDTDQSRTLHGFFACLALCHTVLVNEDEQGSIEYKAQSPDEQALVQAAAAVGFVFRGREKNIVRLQVPSSSVYHDREIYRNSGTTATSRMDIEEVGRPLDQITSQINEYELLEVIEFTSSRKRMSVVVRRLIDGQPQSGELYLLVKGADNVIFERLATGQDELKERTDDQLEQFANQGLRTLCLAYRKLDPDQLEEWSRKYTDACSQLGSDRQDLVSLVEDELESNLILLGATAIEDKLQDGVPQAIADLKRAGIKVWVATGDKLETAVAIAKSCHLIGHDVNLIVIRGGAYGQRASAYDQIRKSLIDFFDLSDLIDQLKEQPPDHSTQQPHSRPSISNSAHADLASIVGEDNGQKSGGYGLVIDGGSLNYALEEPFTREALLELATRCSSVVCCRTSPKQKSEIVKLVKNGIGAHTLAIGDGANDVSMIQTADIGVGVSGEEGMQAVNSSDYAISQFRFICKLLFVHGHWSYDRNAKMIFNFFYKEIIGIIALWLFQFWCAYSSTIMYEYTYLLFYNVFWTLLPVITIGIFDQDISQKVLMQVPELYSQAREANLFGLRRFGVYMMQGVYQGSICFFFITFSYYNSTSARTDGLDVGFTEFSTVVIVAIIIACNLFHGLDQSIWNWWLLGGVLFGPITILAYTAVYSAVKPGFIWTSVYGNNTYLWPSAYWWFGILLTVVLSLLPHYLWKYYKDVYDPNDLHVLRYVDKRDPDHDYQADDQMPFKRENEKYLDEIKETTHSLERMKSETATGPIGPEIMRSRTSLMHDMATGQLSPHDRGFNFEQADGVGGYAVGNRLRRYNTSALSLGASGAAKNEQQDGNNQARQLANVGRDRSKSIRIGNLQFAFGGHHRRQGTTTTVGSSTGHTSLAKRISTFLHPNHALHHHQDHNSSETEPDVNKTAPTTVSPVIEDRPTSSCSHVEQTP